jgi:hypothetical protein
VKSISFLANFSPQSETDLATLNLATYLLRYFQVFLIRSVVVCLLFLYLQSLLSRLLHCLLIIENRTKHLKRSTVQEIYSLAIESRSGIELQHIVFPCRQLLKGKAGKGQIEGIPDLVLHLLSECTQVVLDFVFFLSLVCLHHDIILKPVA